MKTITIVILLFLTTLKGQAQMHPGCFGTGIDWQTVGPITNGSSFTNPTLGNVTISITVGTVDNPSTNFGGTYPRTLHNFAGGNNTLTICWTNTVSSLILPIGGTDLSETITIVAASSTITPILLESSVSFFTSNKLVGSSGTLDDLKFEELKIFFEQSEKLDAFVLVEVI